MHEHDQEKKGDTMTAKLCGSLISRYTNFESRPFVECPITYGIATKAPRSIRLLTVVVDLFYSRCLLEGCADGLGN